MTNFEREFAPWDERFQKYKEFLRGNSRGTAGKTKVSRIALFWSWLKDEKILPNKLDSYHFLEYVEALQSGQLCRNTDRYSQSTIVSLKRACLNWVRHLYKQGHFLLNPFAEFSAGDLPKDQRLILEVLSVDQVQRILKAPDLSTPLGIRNRAIFELAYGSGLRVGEIASLNLANIDLRQRIVNLRDTKNNWDRKVPMTEASVDALEHYLKEAKPKLSDGERTTSLWMNMFARPLQRAAIVAIPQTYRKRLKFHFSMHSFRRAFATHLLQGGAGTFLISKLLGHRQLDSSQHYVRLQLEELRVHHQRYHPRA